MLVNPFFSFTQPMMCVCVWRDPFMVYVSVDEKSVQGRVVRKKTEDGEKKEDKEHIGTPKESIRWIGAKEGQDS